MVVGLSLIQPSGGPVDRRPERRHDEGVDSSHLTRQQAEALRLQVAQRLCWLNRLAERMQRVGFSPQDDLFLAAQRARNSMQDLTTAAHYASCEHGVGREAKGGG